MFGAFAEKIKNICSSLGRSSILTEGNIQSALREVRLALLEADVNYGVAKRIIERVKEKALGKEALRGLSPGDRFLQLLHRELKEVMGGEDSSLSIGHCPSVILLCGLQGAGKTTQAAKLALYLQKKGKKVLLVGCDLQRPAAIDQLEALALQAGASFYVNRILRDPIAVALEGITKGRKEGFDAIIFDTAGRLQVDAELMQELLRLREAISPHEILFVASAAMGQESVKVAAEFDRALSLTGSILTMLDSSARAGAALSIREVTGKPLKFEGTGEKLEDFQLFHPSSMADRILGMGDLLTLMRKAEEHFDEQEGKDLEKKIKKNSLTYEDFLHQMRSLKKMGPVKHLIAMIPGASSLSGLEDSEGKLNKFEALIFSMTRKEREGKEELTLSRRNRIAKGSGLSLEEVNQAVKKFEQMKGVMQQLTSFQKKKGGFPPLQDLFGKSSPSSGKHGPASSPFSFARRKK